MAVEYLKNYCDVLYSEFTEMKRRVDELKKNIEEMPESDRITVFYHLSRLDDLKQTLDSMLAELTDSCPVEETPGLESE